MANPLTANLAELFKKLQGPDGSMVYKDPKIQEMYEQFLVKQGKKLETPRISTAPESIENFSKATAAHHDALTGSNRILLDYEEGRLPLRREGSLIHTDEYGRNLDHQVRAFKDTQKGALGHAAQVQHDRTHVTMPALMALEEKRIENANTDALLSRLLQGAGALGILFS